ncbi:MAG: single-stranded DNA-binding protein [Proteobacteria bacterium]|nr:single-stranded DNA-binding protein [Pseudomonadota bacterium]
MGDINKVWISGLVITQPVLTRLASKTPFATFTIQVNERFIDKNGSAQLKANIIKIESLGKSAEVTAQKVKQGSRYTIDGYLRQDSVDGQDHTRVRTFAVYPDDSLDTVNYRQGLKQAVEILRKSRDLKSAIERIEELIQ